MNETHDATVIDMWARIGHEARLQNEAFIRRVRATGELEPHYAAYDRLAKLGGQLVDMEDMSPRPNLRLVVSEDQQ